MRLLCIRPQIVSALSISPFLSLSCYQDLDGILAKYGYVCPDSKDNPDVIRAVAFAVVTYENGEEYIAVSRRDDIYTLGFGSVVPVKMESTGQSYKAHIIDTLYDELDIYLPDDSYDLCLNGIIYTDQRPEDQRSIGMIFSVKLHKAIMTRELKDGKTVTLVPVSKIDNDQMHGWSSIILAHYKQRELALNI